MLSTSVFSSESFDDGEGGKGVRFRRRMGSMMLQVIFHARGALVFGKSGERMIAEGSAGRKLSWIVGKSRARPSYARVRGGALKIEK